MYPSIKDFVNVDFLTSNVSSSKKLILLIMLMFVLRTYFLLAYAYTGGISPSAYHFLK